MDLLDPALQKREKGTVTFSPGSGFATHWISLGVAWIAAALFWFRPKRLRRKLGYDATSPAYIFTERQVGYRRPSPGDL